jgi:hypothetical protein
MRTGTFHDDPADLMRKPAKLEEEVMEFRAAVEIWTEVCRRTMHIAVDSEASGGEMR